MIRDAHLLDTAPTEAGPAKIEITSAIIEAEIAALRAESIYVENRYYDEACDLAEGVIRRALQNDHENCAARLFV